MDGGFAICVCSSEHNALAIRCFLGEVSPNTCLSTRLQFFELLEADQKEIFFKNFDQQDEKWPRVFNTHDSMKAYEDRMRIGGLGTLATTQSLATRTRWAAASAGWGMCSRTSRAVTTSA